MSHFPGHRLEDFLTDLYGIVDAEGDYGDAIRRVYKGQWVLTKEQFAALVKIYEPIRADVERGLDDYDDERSWRDYKYYAMPSYISDEVDAAASKYLESIEADVPKTKGLFE